MLHFTLIPARLFTNIHPCPVFYATFGQRTGIREEAPDRVDIPGIVNKQSDAWDNFFSPDPHEFFDRIAANPSGSVILGPEWKCRKNFKNGVR